MPAFTTESATARPPAETFGRGHGSLPGLRKAVERHDAEVAGALA